MNQAFLTQTQLATHYDLDVGEFGEILDRIGFKLDGKPNKLLLDIGLADQVLRGERDHEYHLNRWDRDTVFEEIYVLTGIKPNGFTRMRLGGWTDLPASLVALLDQLD